MTTRRRLFWTVTMAVAYAIFINIWTAFAPQVQADIALKQMENDDISYGIGRAAAEWHLEGWFLLIFVLLTVALWLPVFKQILTKRAT